MLITVSVLKTCKNLEGTCHLLFFCCVMFWDKTFSVYRTYFYYFIQKICMYVVWWLRYMCLHTNNWSLSQPPSFFACVVSAYLTPSSQLPSFPTNWYRIQQQYLLKMHLSFLFKRRELFNWRIWFPVKYFTTELACHTICSCKYLLTVINGVVVWDNLGISEHCVPHHL